MSVGSNVDAVFMWQESLGKACVINGASCFILKSFFGFFSLGRLVLLCIRYNFEATDVLLL